MVQTFDFMSKNYKHVIIQKVTFSTKKELLAQPYTRKPCINTQKSLCVYQSNSVVFTYTPISLSTQRLLYMSTEPQGFLVSACVSLCQEFYWLRKLLSR